MPSDGLKRVLPESLKGYLFIDVEASGLHDDSYPIEIGWCSCDLALVSFLIKPHRTWGDEGWSYVSEKAHGITRQELDQDGIDVIDAARRLNDICVDKIAVLSENAEFDSAWIDRLSRMAGVPRGFTISDSARFERVAAAQSRLLAGEMQELQERVKGAFPHPHRAGADARRAAALFLAITAPDAIDAIIAAA